MKLTRYISVRPTLERKFIALASVIILLCSFMANIVLLKIYRNQLFGEAEKRALLLAESTAISFTNTLLYQMLGLVEEGGLIENSIHDLILKPETAVVGVTVYGPSGKILATNDYERYFEQSPIDSALRWAGLKSPLIRLSSDASTFSIIYPMKISSRSFGTLQMQFTRLPEIHRINRFKQWMLLVSLGFAFFGIFLAFIVARTLAKPIKRLAVEMTRVNTPDHIAELNTQRRDEIGDLERSFIEMLWRLKEAAEEREKHQRALIQTEKLASIGTLVAGLAHEINNPLAGIRNCLRRIQDRPSDNTQTQKYAKLMDEALARIERTVRDLLDFSRQKDFIFRPTNLNDVIKAACELIILQLRKRNLSLELNLQEDLPSIPGDSQYLQQVFLNLLLNAVDATPDGGKISLTTYLKNGYVIAEVQDSGQGIPVEIRDKIFDPFFTTKTVGKGTGLGLSVSKSIIEGHRGSIDFQSGDNGTVFRVSFSLKDLSQNRSEEMHEAQRKNPFASTNDEGA